MPELFDDDTLLTRDMAAVALTEAGYPVKSKTLATKATRGGGPPYRLFGVRPLYRWGDALEWAQERLSAPRRSTSEKDTDPGAALDTGEPLTSSPERGGSSTARDARHAKV